MNKNIFVSKEKQEDYIDSVIEVHTNNKFWVVRRSFSTARRSRLLIEDVCQKTFESVYIYFYEYPLNEVWSQHAKPGYVNQDYYIRYDEIIPLNKIPIVVKRAVDKLAKQLNDARKKEKQK